MKESTLIQMRNRIDSLEKTLLSLRYELVNLKNLSIGTLETIKKMPDYTEAIQELKKEVSEKSSEEQEANA